MQESPSTHLALYDNISLLDNLLCQTLEKQLGSELFETIISISKDAKDPAGDIPHAIQKIRQHIQGLNSDQILNITRAFAQFLNLTSIAEQYHRVRRRRWHQRTNHAPQPGSLEAVFPEICKTVPPETVYETITQLNIELVLTAHPTEVTRRTLIHKYNKIANGLARFDRQDLTPVERQRVVERLHEEITAAWQTEELRRQKPSAIDEAKWGFAVVEESLWNAIPEFMRDLDTQLKSLTGKELPIGVVPIRFASWMGGDRDGNPNVTADVTREVILLARWMAADLYWRDINALRDALSLNECSPELRALVGDAQEPYRAILRSVKQRLVRTKFWAECQIERREVCPTPDVIYTDSQDLLEPLMVCYRSLLSIGADVVAKGRLFDTIRRLTCFGLSLLPLDIRQHSEKHLKLMIALTKALNLGSYETWSEAERQDFFKKSLKEKEYFQPKKAKLTPELQEYLETFRVIAESYPKSFGSYIISMASKPSDALLVLVLQITMGVENPLKVVPLFETQADLQNAAQCIDDLLSIEEYRKACSGIQQVMIGYSDSAKDAGVLAASWAQYQAQESLIAIGKKHKVRIIFFHGRGGSVGRGGGPSHLAIRSLPPGSIQSGLRVTQQGEVIRHRFGLQKIAERTLAIYTSATLEATLLPQSAPKPEWRQLMDSLSAVSLSTYEKLIKNNPDFPAYFESVTPIFELDKIAIASRPTRRQDKTGIDSLRAIPWVFAWTQNRLILPAWFGVGEAFSSSQPDKMDFLKKVLNEWTYLSSVLSTVEMALAKTDRYITEEYERQLCPKSLWYLGQELRESLTNTEAQLLSLFAADELLAINALLKRSIAVRSPYLLVLHVLQIELLKKTRQSDVTVDENLERALLVSIAGIAAGMHNTG